MSKILLPPANSVPEDLPFPPWRRVGSLIVLSGHGPWNGEGWAYTDIIDDENTLVGAKAADLACQNALATVQKDFGLESVESVVELIGFIRCGPQFTQHAEVLNGASNALERPLGPPGAHARCAMGATSLPFGISIEVRLAITIG